MWSTVKGFRMERIAFQLRLKPDKAEEYDRVHKDVWPELLQELKSFGVREYSIFRRNQQLVLYLRVTDFDRLLTQLAESEINLKWQGYVKDLFEGVPDIKQGETFAMMHEVFYMSGEEDNLNGLELSRGV